LYSSQRKLVTDVLAEAKKLISESKTSKKKRRVQTPSAHIKACQKTKRLIKFLSEQWE
jgi:hypothetical protein